MGGPQEDKVFTYYIIKNGDTYYNSQQHAWLDGFTGCTLYNTAKSATLNARDLGEGTKVFEVQCKFTDYTRTPYEKEI